MTTRDLLGLAAGNLRRTKLRTFLTTSGVVIAIATFFAMVSFGVGNQALVAEQYETLGFFSTMHVYPREAEGDSVAAAEIDDDALAELAVLPGVRLAYPFDPLTVRVAMLHEDSLGAELVAQARAVPAEAFGSGTLASLECGAGFAGSDEPAAVVTADLLEELGFSDPDSALGRRLAVTMRTADLDSALFGTMAGSGDLLRRMLSPVVRDSLFDPAMRSALIRREINSGLGRFMSNLRERPRVVVDTLAVAGVLRSERGQGRNRARLLLPHGVARGLGAGRPSMDGDLAGVFTALQGGVLFGEVGAPHSYPQATLDLEPTADWRPIKAAVEDSLGLRAFSYAEDFDEIRRVFVYFNMALGALGMIALVTAALGIANTMIMAITERRREIGILKSLGAHEGEVRALFLAESAAIGLAGSVVGMAVGWVGTRVATAIFAALMERQGVPPVDPFAFPWWLLAIAVAFGMGVSMLAGLYPAGRAARVDPCVTLRGE